MNKFLPYYLIALVGLAMMGYQVGATAKHETPTYVWMMPLGLLLCMGGAFTAMYQARKAKKE